MMIEWTIMFLILTIISGFLSFSGISGLATGLAKVLLAIFAALFFISLIKLYFSRPQKDIQAR